MHTESTSGLRGTKRMRWLELLAQAGLKPDEDPEQTVLIWDGDALIATGSRQENLLKCIAVAPGRQGEDLLSAVITPLRQEAFQQGYRHLQLYTKPANEYLFSSLFFYSVARTGEVLLMENRKDGIRDFLNSLPAAPASGAVAAAVMHCDPFTLGHRHLIETAAKACAWVYVFVLSEDKGCFSTGDRMEMVKQGTADLANVTVLPTGPYLISSATFPTYFLKNREQAERIQCSLDIEIFCRHFVPRFGITHRYVGNEPLSPVTNQYNEALRTLLPGRGITLREIPRLEKDNVPVSAGAVRTFLRDGNPDAIRTLVPETTFAYLKQKHLIK